MRQLQYKCQCGYSSQDNFKFCPRCGIKSGANESVIVAEKPANSVAGATCPKCGRPVDPSFRYCPECNMSLVKTYSQLFEKGRMDEEAFIYTINAWLQQNRNAANITCEFQFNHRKLSAVLLKYELLDGINQYHYALRCLKNFNMISHKRAEKLLDDFKRENPNAVILKAQESVLSVGQNGSSILFGGFMSFNSIKVWVFYKSK
jgi:hypothetical protein